MRRALALRPTLPRRVQVGGTPTHTPRSHNFACSSLLIQRLWASHHQRLTVCEPRVYHSFDRLLSAANERMNGHGDPVCGMLRDPNVGVGGRRLLLCTLRTAARRDGPAAYFDFAGEDGRAVYSHHILSLASTRLVCSVFVVHHRWKNTWVPRAKGSSRAEDVRGWMPPGRWPTQQQRKQR